ncbi:hypothetical protein BT96DRAFT_923417 [Gymnopus androsaceus JB14]|uniref:Uncharacterized protein n=1 Tax=Gymnopus androsaceus JB14 TaxID=1447944 RepID=A0A6A4H8Y1_9AGAR|nr:hypothetical protein BT96DRAFT_923417 [Gymnopus androsaceus JB14]
MEPSLTPQSFQSTHFIAPPTLLSHHCFLQELSLPLFYWLMMHFKLSCSDDALVTL